MRSAAGNYDGEIRLKIKKYVIEKIDKIARRKGISRNDYLRYLLDQKIAEELEKELKEEMKEYY